MLDGLGGVEVPTRVEFGVTSATAEPIVLNNIDRLTRAATAEKEGKRKGGGGRDIGPRKGASDGGPGLRFGAVAGGLIRDIGNLDLVFIEAEGDFPGRQDTATAGTGDVLAAAVRDPQKPIFSDDKCGDVFVVGVGFLSCSDPLADVGGRRNACPGTLRVGKGFGGLVAVVGVGARNSFSSSRPHGAGYYKLGNFFLNEIQQLLASGQ